jgi:hypothetical protein
MLDVQAPEGVKLKHNRNRPEDRLAPNEETADDAARLERALERIALLAQRRQEGTTESGSAEIAMRLDALIAQLRAALNHSE